MSNLTPVKSFEEYVLFANGYGYSETQNLYLSDKQSPHGFSCYAVSRNYPVPTGLEGDDAYRFGMNHTNELNFWIQREAIRFLEGTYLQCGPIARALRHQPDEIKFRHFTHMVHTSIEDTTMVAYTPDHRYGLADRQVRMKVGRYLQKFYADVFSQEQIRDIANNVQVAKIEWAYGSEAIRRVYENGPHSCMVSCGSHGGTHPVEVYGYQYADGSYQFGLAYLTDVCGSITARCLCDLKSMKYTRFYGDDGCILGSKLDALGYEKVYSMDDLGCRLKHVGDYDGKPIVAYLDGNGKNVDLKWDHERNESYWLWCENGNYCADEPDGLLDEEEEEEEEETYYCECCDCNVTGDEYSYSDYHDIRVCDSCQGDNYVYAYYGRHGDQTWVHQDDVIEVNGDYYTNESRTLSHHDIIQTVDGEYDFEQNCTSLHDGRWVQDDHEDLVCLHDGDYALLDDDDVIKLIDGQYALESDSRVVELENDGGHALEDSDAIVQVDSGEWYLKTDADIVQLLDGDWYLKSDSDIVEVTEGVWMLWEDLEEETEPQAVQPLHRAANEATEGV